VISLVVKNNQIQTAFPLKRKVNFLAENDSSFHQNSLVIVQTKKSMNNSIFKLKIELENIFIFVL
jgi:hypothetical protein